ncbi:hypothetical protein [Motiliproteus sp. MSK22-1]|uniref:hypothetical protein n=1 Tax=Motiliproteus sp. MSK22-1 TaxID=1897630 RepID=UPI000975D191|nr:hypothetical protein [Motiliproteus sp. MSK22-1]OMH30316.1 hypothetical protein BGP75_18190 [Motiliproteus sp. MSK22-1]
MDMSTDDKTNKSVFETEIEAMLGRLETACSLREDLFINRLEKILCQIDGFSSAPTHQQRLLVFAIGSFACHNNDQELQFLCEDFLGMQIDTDWQEDASGFL